MIVMVDSICHVGKGFVLGKLVGSSSGGESERDEVALFLITGNGGVNAFFGIVELVEVVVGVVVACDVSGDSPVFEVVGTTDEGLVVGVPPSHDLFEPLGEGSGRFWIRMVPIVFVGGGINGE